LDLRHRVVLVRAGGAGDLSPGGAVCDDHGVGDGETGRAFGGNAVVTLGQGDGLRLGGLGALAGDGLHVHRLGAPQPHGDLRAGGESLDVDTGFGVVAELQVDGAVEDGGLAGGRIARDVVAVLGVARVLEAGEVGGVVEGGGELADAAADRGAGPAMVDDAGLDVAFGGAARAGESIEGERIPRFHDRAVHL